MSILTSLPTFIPSLIRSHRASNESRTGTEIDYKQLLFIVLPSGGLCRVVVASMLLRRSCDGLRKPLPTAVTWALIEEPNESLPGVARRKVAQAWRKVMRKLGFAINGVM